MNAVGLVTLLRRLHDVANRKETLDHGVDRGLMVVVGMQHMSIPAVISTTLDK